MMVNQRTIDLIKEFEGFRSDAYRDSAGIYTIGYGTTANAGVGIVPVPGMSITKEAAERYLHLAVNKFAAQIDRMITQPINENEFGAFVSLAYNIGPLAFSKSSALRYFNAGNRQAAANAILMWNKATVNGRKQVLRGLVRRREAERALFLTDPAKNPAPRSGASTGKVAAQTGAGVALTAAFLAIATKWAELQAWLASLFGG